MPFFLAMTLFSTAFVIVVAASSFFILQACELAWSPLQRFADCRPQSELAAEASLVALHAEQSELQRTIYDLERELAARQCVATGPDPRRPLSAKGWNNQATSMLYGCWDVSLGYQTRDVDTDEVASYSEWQICFDTKGNGREVMRDAAGIVCEGPISAEYTDGGLFVVEPDNLPCGDGGYIHRREAMCQLGNDGSATCSTLQPETNGQAPVSLARRVFSTE